MAPVHERAHARTHAHGRAEAGAPARRVQRVRLPRLPDPPHPVDAAGRPSPTPTPLRPVCRKVVGAAAGHGVLSSQRAVRRGRGRVRWGGGGKRFSARPPNRLSFPRDVLRPTTTRRSDRRRRRALEGTRIFSRPDDGGGRWSNDPFTVACSIIAMLKKYHLHSIYTC